MVTLTDSYTEVQELQVEKNDVPLHQGTRFFSALKLEANLDSIREMVESMEFGSVRHFVEGLLRSCDFSLDDTLQEVVTNISWILAQADGFKELGNIDTHVAGIAKIEKATGTMVHQVICEGLVAEVGGTISTN